MMNCYSKGWPKMGGNQYCGDASGELSGTSGLQCLEYTIYSRLAHNAYANNA